LFGDKEAIDRLMSVTYSELRPIAQIQLTREREQRLQPTALANQPYPARQPGPGAFVLA
jgi:hypothetical protein